MKKLGILTLILITMHSWEWINAAALVILYTAYAITQYPEIKKEFIIED